MTLKTALFSLLVLPAALAATAKPDAEGFAALKPEDDQARAAQFAYHLLGQGEYHYAPKALDDALSRDIFDRFIEGLDGERLFFLASDIARFESQREGFDDAIRDRRLQPAFDIFNVYAQRVAERTAEAREMLAGEFDFSRDESWVVDRDELPWPADAEAAREAWRKRVKNDVLRLRLAGKEHGEIVKTLDKRYASFESRVREIKSDDVFQTFMNAWAGAIEPHTSYMTPRTSENFNIAMRLSLEGIGAVLQREDEYTVIRSIVPGGPASLGGELQVGDRVVGVGQGEGGPFTDVVGWRVDDVVELIRGPKDTTVRLDVLPAEAGLDGPHRTIAIVRDKVKLEEQAARSEVIEVGEGEHAQRIGVISLPTFYQDFDARRRDEPDYRSATRDVAKLLAGFADQDVDGVLVDLRNNGGGSLNEAIELTGLFIDRGPVVQVRASTGALKVERDRDPGVAWDGPMAVLVNRASASASEIFAAAIQDYGRGVIIGEPTFGKGTVQNLVDLDVFERGAEPRYGQLKLTVAQFFRVDGGSTQHRGVVPDISFPVTLDAEDYGESAYDNALPWTRISSADYQRVGDIAPLVPLLAARHDARVAEDREFQWWAEDVARYREQRERTELSLNEDVRRAERAAEEKRRAERAEARRQLGLEADAEALARLDDGLQADERRVVDQVEREEEAEDDPDVLLREAAAILADAVRLLANDKALAARVLPEGALPRRDAN